jgi:hypothetical protein
MHLSRSGLMHRVRGQRGVMLTPFHHDRYQPMPAGAGSGGENGWKTAAPGD